LKNKKPLDWIPIYIDKHLFGSTRLELEPDERSVWMDLLVLSGKDRGFIRANESVPYLSAQLAGMLVISEELLERTINKCVSKEIKKIIIQKDGTLYLPSWEQYAFTPRHKRRFESMSAKTDTVSAKGDPILKNSNSKRESNSKRKRERESLRGREREKEKKAASDEAFFAKKPPAKKEPFFNFEKREFINITEKDLKGWKEAFPACDIKAELKKMREWLLANPDKKKLNYRRFIVNWLSKQQDRGGTDRAIGAPFRPMTRKEERKEKIKEWTEKPIEDEK